jgi:tRNA(Ile)-lysidine synthase
MDILSILDLFFRREAPAGPGDGVVVAFSGGPDSTALLCGMAALAPRRGLRLTAAHLDHGLDAGSAGRAAAAARLAAALSVPLVAARSPAPPAPPTEDVSALRRPAESPEAAARRVRYAFLEEVRERLGARWIATAHHRDDQAETVLLRLLYGSGLAGLAGVRPVHGRVVRPLLEAGRDDLAAAVEASGLVPVDDPTNRRLDVPRNRIRHRLLPALQREDGEVAVRLARLAAAARRAGAAIERRLDIVGEGEIERQAVAIGRDAISIGRDAVSIGRDALAALPSELLPFAFAALHRAAGVPYPAGGAARAEVLRQLARGERARCDCGAGWRWEERAGRLILRRSDEEVADFTYTLEIPGELDIPEIAARVRLTREPVEPWMKRGEPRRAGLALPLEPGDRVTVRNRRPGDRLHPLGAGGSRRLKEILIDRRVPRGERDRLPLLCVDGRIAWVPGITIDHRFRLAGETTAWVAEVTTE